MSPSRRRGTQQIVHPIELDLVGDEPERKGGQEVDQEMAKEVTGPVRRNRQLEGEFEEEHRADRQVGPREE